jgi:radical SAM superfamily enzyme YgiQ (UPF0313 family)
LVNTAFSENSYWNYKIACELVGRTAPSAPLGLITVAAILPQHWQFRLLDLNAEEFSQSAWDWAEIVCLGGMLPQQTEMLKYLRRAKTDKKLVVVGGADPSSQPELYADADARVLGEGEVTIPQWLDHWRKTGSAAGLFQSEEKPDITQSPIPRFDLLKVKNYLQIGVQYSRGCPFNCEFCDIIELFGRKPRTKAPEQFLKELQTLYDLGYRGSVEFVDDNFIGNKRFVKRDLLPALIDWQRQRRYPFYFHTEASMNLADDKKLLRQMRAVDFRFIFMGIESPDPEILLQTQKSQNTVGDIVKRINTIYEHGMVVLGGFIMGFDGEKEHTDLAMIKLVEEASVCAAMVGLLVALPNTQLTRRLLKEGRLVDFRGNALLDPSNISNGGDTSGAIVDIVDQTTAGLNFITKRNRADILSEYANVVRTIYNPQVYANRVLRMAKRTKARHKYFPPIREGLVEVRGLIRMARHYRKRGMAKLFWGTVARAAPLGLFRFDLAMRMMSLFLHFHKQTKFILDSIDRQLAYGREVAKGQERALLEEEMKQAAVMAKVARLPTGDIQSFDFAASNS